MGIFEDIEEAKKLIMKQKYESTIYVLSPDEYNREKEREAEKQLGIIRPPK